MAERPYQDLVERSRELRTMPGFLKEMYLRAARLGMRAAAAEVAGQSLCYEYRRRDRAAWGFVHPSSCYPGQFRFSLFDEDSWFSHDDGYESSVDALFELFRWGYRDPDPGALGRVMITDRWKRGIERLEVIRHANALRAVGKYEEAMRLEREYSYASGMA